MRLHLQACTYLQCNQFSPSHTRSFVQSLQPMLRILNQHLIVFSFLLPVCRGSDFNRFLPHVCNRTIAMARVSIIIHRLILLWGTREHRRDGKTLSAIPYKEWRKFSSAFSGFGRRWLIDYFLVPTGRIVDYLHFNRMRRSVYSLTGECEPQNATRLCMVGAV